MMIFFVLVGQVCAETDWFINSRLGSPALPVTYIWFSICLWVVPGRRALVAMLWQSTALGKAMCKNKNLSQNKMTSSFTRKKEKVQN